jgi:uncharacterized protein with PIN domain|tara:strand:+ start:327 stop:509 length:183 start_codon:yes stop_codon:yes gene_type:complete
MICYRCTKELKGIRYAKAAFVFPTEVEANIELCPECIKELVELLHDKVETWPPEFDRMHS